MDMWNKNSGSNYKLPSIRPITKQFQSVSIPTFCQVLNLYLALQKKDITIWKKQMSKMLQYIIDVISFVAFIN